MTNAASRTCLKCNHVHPGATMSDTEACPKCGAIYSRVEAYVKAEQARPPSRARSTEAQPSQLSARAPISKVDTAEFVTTMRAKSLYPTFRGMVRIVAWLCYLMCVAVVVGGFITGNGTTIIGAVFVALLLAVFTTAGKEAALMIADLSDATVLSAARAHQRDESD